ncbi:MAG: DUF1007 family protein [Spirochaetales bacterium]|nr:DUF1007 family protein [Spirochaetales bacterium]
MRKLLLLLTLILCSCFLLSAHPHMLLLPKLEFECDGETFLGVWVDWGFDSMFSLSIIDSYDWNKDGEFDADETQSVHDYAFINLENYGYFLSIREGDQRYTPSGTSGFSVRQVEGKLFYRFFVSFQEWSLGKDISVNVFDPTYFCAVQYADPAIIVRQASGAMPDFRLEENKDYPVYYNPMGTVDDDTTYDQWKPGLETAYPEEAHVWF